MKAKYYKKKGLQYYEVENTCKPLVILHAQGVDSQSYRNVVGSLSKQFHVYLIDCYGHGGSLHDRQLYTVRAAGEAVIDFIKEVIGEKVFLLGHSSGGLIAGFVAAFSDCCERLVLEDPPFFSSEGERRKSTFNFVDLSTVCHSYLSQKECSDFVLYYFSNQYAWQFFPAKSRNKLRAKLIANAAAYRGKYPERNLKVRFWSKAALEAFCGMNNYDPHFGQAFYDNSFHCGIPHEQILRSIRCKTLFLKAKTAQSPTGLLLAALNEEDVSRVEELISDCTLLRFNCGHSIHSEKPCRFVKCIKNFLK